MTFAPTLKHLVKRALGRPSLPPPVKGVADAAWYDAAYTAIDTYHADYWHSHYYFLWTLMAERIRGAGATRVLDIGCGPGQFAACLFDLAGITTYTGLDFSATAVEMAKKQCPRGAFHVGDALTTELHRTVPHDITVCTEVLEHVPEDTTVLERFTGRVLCTVPNFPYQSHVRHFRSADEVQVRYAPLLERCSVLPMRGHYSPDHVYYLIDGVR